MSDLPGAGGGPQGLGGGLGELPRRAVRKQVKPADGPGLNKEASPLIASEAPSGAMPHQIDPYMMEAMMKQRAEAMKKLASNPEMLQVRLPISRPAVPLICLI